MKLLLDTHIILRWLTKPDALTSKARKAIASPDNLVFYSAASTWEIVIKASMGKLPQLDLAAAQAHLAKEVILPLAIEPSHTIAAATLGDLHKDPFDRLLLALARQEKMTLITRDEKMTRYRVKTIIG